MKIIENSVTERFLRYISYDTQSKEEGEQVPSTTKQLELGKLLTTELKEMGVANVRMDEHGYIYGEIPANTEEKITSLGFIAHMDTSPALSGKDVKPQFVENYDRLPAGGTGDAEPARVQDEKPDDAADKRGGEEKGLEKLYLCADDCADQEKEASPTECAQIRIKCAFHTRSLLLLQYTRQGLRFMETPERRGGRVARHPGGEGGAF